MALNKQPVSVNFSQGLDQKTDPKQLSVGRFLSLYNTIFDKAGLLQKRNGFGKLTAILNSDATFLTTFNGNLTAIGSSFNAYSAGSETWVNKGAIKQVDLKTLPLIRSNTNQSYADAVVAANGLVCTVFTDNVPVSGSNTLVYKYVVADSNTGQNIVAPVVIAAKNAPKVFLLGNYFIIIYGTAADHLTYISINVFNPTVIAAPVDISAQFTPSTTGAFDAYMAFSNLYIAWNGNDGGGAIRVRYISSTLNMSSQVVYTGKVATLMSVTADSSSANNFAVYVTFYDSGSQNGYSLAVTPILAPILAPTLWTAAVAILNITSAAQTGINTILFEETATSPTSIVSHFVRQRTITKAGALGTAADVVRSVGLAAKAFILDSVIYFFGVYSTLYQPTYFLINASGKVISRFAYSNGGTYQVTGLPNSTVSGELVYVPYLFKDLIEAFNKDITTTNASQIYSQTGINLATFNFDPEIITSSEIGSNLQLSGGFVWAYDGYLPVEQNFFLWPDDIRTSNAATGGLQTPQAYYYAVTYEWADNQGNIFRSAPSIATLRDISASGTSTNLITVTIPTLRLTYKISNPVKIVVYRWSTAQPIFYQATSITLPTLNSTTVDYVTFADGQADATIVGNNILYTTGGVIEDIAPPATSNMTLFQSRLFLIDAEDRNLLWYSKQVIEATPVEMSDLLTIYVAPTTGAQGSTGPMTALSVLDDKLIIFKQDAAYYINGTGPDNTGANSQYSDPIFITATVGCANQNSIVFQPAGLMFQSDKGIWLLGRDLSTQYIGAPVEDFVTTAGATVLSAVSIPGTNQVRFTLDTGITLMFDYYFNQWGAFQGIPSLSSTLYEGIHTYINSAGSVFQETPGEYLDGSNPVLMSFKTGWFNLAGLQGYERAYFFYLLGDYISPHKLQLSIAYDYNVNPSQQSIILPDNYNGPLGSGALLGSDSPFGGNPSLEDWRIFFQKGKCQAFQISMQEVFDPSFGTVAGAGLTLSGLNAIVGMKKGYRVQSASRSVG